MNKLKSFWILGMVLAVMLFPSLSSALTMSNVNGAWVGVVGGVYVGYYSVGIAYGNGTESQVRWGDPVSGGIPAGQSGLGFTGIAPPPVSFGIGDAFEVGQMRHFNNPVYDPSSSADLAITMNFTDPSGLNTTQTFTFNINETPNTTGGSPGDDDFIYFPNAFPAETFIIGGTKYTLQLLGFGPDPGSIVPQLQSPEGGTTGALLWGKITTPPPAIPEPSTLILLGIGIAGIAGYGKIRKKKA